MWIEQSDKSNYIGSSIKTGIRVRWDRDLPDETILSISKFIQFLRARYYFPIRCNLLFSNKDKFIHPRDSHKFFGIFFSNDNQKRKIYPQIYVTSKTTKSNPIEDIYYTLSHELTHYFQWFFYEDNKRTERSLEIEANRWAIYIVSSYLE